MGRPGSVIHTLFFALQPDALTAFEARRLALELGLTPNPRLHVSLVGLGGDADPPSQRWIDRVVAAASRVRMPAFVIELNTLSTFGAGAVVLRGEDGVIGIHMLCDAICAALAAEGLAGKPAAEPHLTVAWSRRFIHERRVAPVRWTARQLVLIDSHQGAGRHEVMGTWPLQARAAFRNESSAAHASGAPGGGN